MSSTCPTVRVVNPESPGGFKVINESDLTSEHELWGGDDKSDSRERAPAQVLNLNSPPAAKKNR